MSKFVLDNTYMLMKRLFYILVLLFVGCVDENIDLDNIQGTIGVKTDNLVIPLGSLKEKSLGEMIGEVEGLEEDSATGEYTISYLEDNQKFTISGVDGKITLPQSKYTVDIDYPSFTLESSSYELDELFDVNARFSGVDLAPLQSVYIPSGIVVTGQQDGKIGHSLEIVVPDYIKSINRVYVKHDDNLPGAPVSVEFDLGSIGDVNGGGSVTVELVAPEGFELYGEDMKPVSDSTFRVENKPFAAGEHKVSFVAYIGSVTNCPSAQGGKLTLPGELEYHVSYTLTSAGGNVTYTSTPTLNVKATLECEDAEVTLAAMELTQKDNTFENEVVIGGMPKEVESVSCIDFVSSQINFNIEGLDWWSDEAVAAGAMDDIWVDVVLPKEFVLSSDNKNFNSSTNTFHATLTELKKGLTLDVDKVDLGGDLAPNSNGEIDTTLTAVLRAGLTDGAKIRLKHLRHNGGVQVVAGYDETVVNLASVTGKVNFEHSESLVVNMGDFDADKINIDALGVSPIIDFTIDNPLTLPLYVSAKLVPVRGGVADASAAVSIEKFELAAATATASGSSVAVTPAKTSVLIAKGAKDDAANGIKGIDCDIESAFRGSLPEKLNIDLTIATDATQSSTLYVLEEYEAKYGYSFALPLSFDSTLALTYSDTATDLNSTLGDIDFELYADGEIFLIAEVKNSTPLNLTLDAQLLDLDGRQSKLQILPAEGKSIISGSTDGVTPVTSTVKLKVTSENSKNILDGLSNVDALKFSLKATSAANGVALSSKQILSVSFKLQLNGNINVDINEL